MKNVKKYFIYGFYSFLIVLFGTGYIYANGDQGLYEDEFIDNGYTVENYNDILVSKSLFDIEPFRNFMDFAIFHTIKLEDFGQDYYISIVECDEPIDDNNDRFESALIWHEKNNIYTPIWSFPKKEWFYLEGLQLIDFNNDNKLDILLYEGHEDVSSTYIYINHISDIKYSDTNFTEVYVRSDDYVNITDIDANNIPEILENSKETHIAEIYTGEIEVVEILESDMPESIMNKIREECKKIYGLYEKYNFDYNMPELKYYFFMRIFEKVRILEYKDGKFRDMTSKYHSHIKWRIAILKELIPFSTTIGENIINGAIRYLDNTINQEKGGAR